MRGFETKKRKREEEGSAPEKKKKKKTQKNPKKKKTQKKKTIFAFIQAEQNRFSVKALCARYGVTRARLLRLVRSLSQCA